MRSKTAQNIERVPERIKRTLVKVVSCSRVAKVGMGIVLTSLFVYSSAVAQPPHHRDRIRDAINAAKEELESQNGDRTQSDPQPESPITINGNSVSLHGKVYEAQDWMNPATDKIEKAIPYVRGNGETDWIAVSSIRDVSGSYIVKDGNHRLLAAIALVKAGKMPGDKVLGTLDDRTFTAAEAVELYDKNLLISTNAPTGYSGFSIPDVVRKFTSWSDEQKSPIKIRTADPQDPFEASRAPQDQILSDYGGWKGKNWWESGELIKHLVETAE